jgi:hypothetical protein
MRILIFIFGLIFFFSCEREDNDLFCYECQTRFEGPGQIYCESEVVIVCEINDKTIRNYEIELQNKAILITGEYCETKCIKIIH